MQIKIENPPNLAEIKNYLPVDNYKPVYCYGDTIYNPHDQIIPIDTQIHEEVHSKQQSQYLSPNIWWIKYLNNRDFRLDQELEAYATQYQWLKDRIPERGYSEALEEMAETLASDLYNTGLNIYQIKTLIRKYNYALR